MRSVIFSSVGWQSHVAEDVAVGEPRRRGRGNLLHATGRARAGLVAPVAATPEAASATNEAEPEPRPKLFTYERVDAFASLMRSNMTLYREERAGAVYPGNVGLVLLVVTK